MSKRKHSKRRREKPQRPLRTYGYSLQDLDLDGLVEEIDWLTWKSQWFLGPDRADVLIHRDIAQAEYRERLNPTIPAH